MSKVKCDRCGKIVNYYLYGIYYNKTAMGICKPCYEEYCRKHAEVDFAFLGGDINEIMWLNSESNPSRVPIKITVNDICGILLEAGNHDTGKFRLGEVIRYTPVEVADILSDKLLGGHK